MIYAAINVAITCKTSPIGTLISLSPFIRIPACSAVNKCGAGFYVIRGFRPSVEAEFSGTLRSKGGSFRAGENLRDLACQVRQPSTVRRIPLL